MSHHSQAIGCVLFVSTLVTPSVCLVKVQPACVTNDSSGCLCFVCPVVLVPWQLWFLLTVPERSASHCSGTGTLHAWLSEPDTTSPSSLTDVQLMFTDVQLHLKAGAWLCLDQACLELFHLIASGRGRHCASAPSLESGISSCSQKWGSHLCPPCHPLQIPDVSQDHGCGPTPFYPHTDEALAEGCKRLFHRYRATGEILLLKSTLFTVRRPHS